MLVEINSNVKDYDNVDVYNDEPQPDGTVKTVAVTYRFLIFQALNTPLQNGPEPWNPAEKMQMYDLTVRCANAARGDGVVELDPGERHFIINRSLLVNTPLAHGRLAEKLSDPLEGTQEDAHETLGEGDAPNPDEQT